MKMLMQWRKGYQYILSGFWKIPPASSQNREHHLSRISEAAEWTFKADYQPFW